MVTVHRNAAVMVVPVGSWAYETLPVRTLFASCANSHSTGWICCATADAPPAGMSFGPAISSMPIWMLSIPEIWFPFYHPPNCSCDCHCHRGPCNIAIGPDCDPSYSRTSAHWTPSRSPLECHETFCRKVGALNQFAMLSHLLRGFSNSLRAMESVCESCRELTRLGWHHGSRTFRWNCIFATDMAVPFGCLWLGSPNLLAVYEAVHAGEPNIRLMVLSICS